MTFSTSNWIKIGIGSTLIGVLFGESIRHYWLSRERQRKVEEHWVKHFDTEPDIYNEKQNDTEPDIYNEKQNDNENEKQNEKQKFALKNDRHLVLCNAPLDFFTFLFDYLTMPITRFIGWIGFSTVKPSIIRWKQKVYHSLTVAGRFVNPFVEWQDKNTTDVFAYFNWRLTRKNKTGSPSLKELERNLPLVKPNFELLNMVSMRPASPLSSSWIGIAPPVRQDNYITATWIGQSTCFVQMQGYNILTDPVFSNGILSDWFGPTRLRPAPCKLSDLPSVDIVLISHNHYDHLDLAVLKEIGNSATWYVPLGLKKWMVKHGVERCVELDWWQEHNHDDKLKIIGAPTQHWSGRHFFDVNSTLWASFICKTENASFFHCGDSGYCSAFKEIGKRHGPITFSAIPIGSYEPRYFMQHQHMNPEEACKVHMDTGSRYSLGVHWGTFLMSDEHYMDPKLEFEAARIKHGLEIGSVVTTHLGESKKYYY